MNNNSETSKIPKAVQDLQNLQIINKKRVWKPFMEKYNCQKICELGIFRGENFDLMIRHCPCEAVAVDIWQKDGVMSRNDMGFSQGELNKQYKNFAFSVVGKPFVKIYKEYTYEAVKHFPDNYFDLIYIDADHTYEGCMRDIKDWYSKVKNGRFLIGDDYRTAVVSRTHVKFGVIEAVNEFAKENNLIAYELPRYGWAIIKP